jgi:carboxymethylenebutenolidase
MAPPPPSRTDSVGVADGKFDLYVWLPESGSGPGLTLFQEIFGVGPYIRAVAARLAALGYVVGAPDVMWRVQPHWEADHDQAGLEASIGMMQKFDFAKGIADCVAAVDRVRALPEVTGGTGVIGFCFGGTLAWLTAAQAKPDVAVSYYGSGVAGALDQAGAIECPVIFHFGDSDPYLPNEQVEAIRAAVGDRENVEIHIQSAGHAFDNHEAEMFWDQQASEAAWAHTVRFLERYLPVGAPAR